MSYITWKLSGFPSNRVLGTGTLIDRLRQIPGLREQTTECGAKFRQLHDHWRSRRYGWYFNISDAIGTLNVARDKCSALAKFRFSVFKIMKH